MFKGIAQFYVMSLTMGLGPQSFGQFMMHHLQLKDGVHEQLRVWFNNLSALTSHRLPHGGQAAIL